MWGNGLDWCVSGYGQAAVFCECCIATSCSIKFGKILSSWGYVSFSRKILLRGVSYLVSWQPTNFLLFMFRIILPRIYYNSLHFQSFGWYPCRTTTYCIECTRTSAETQQESIGGKSCRVVKKSDNAKYRTVPECINDLYNLNFWKFVIIFIIMRTGENINGT